MSYWKEGSSDRELAAHMELLTIFRRRLAYNLAQESQFGLETPFSISMMIREAREQISHIKETLRSWGVEVEDQPDEELQASVETINSSLLEIEMKKVMRSQIHSTELGKVSSRSRSFIEDLSTKLDFVVLPESYRYSNHVVFCRVKAPMLHLNLPDEFPIIFVLDRHISSEVMENIKNILGRSVDFGLILIWAPDNEIQQFVNSSLRPALQSDLVVIGFDFLGEIYYPHKHPRETLLQQILREVDLTRLSPFRVGGANLIDSMFFGREDELKNIADIISKTSVVITCGRRMGKTTLLKRLARVVLPAREHPCFFLNCQPVHDYHELRAEMAMAWQDYDVPFDPEQPNSFAQVVATLTESAGKSPIFLLDEVDELLKYDHHNQQRLLKQLRALSLDGRARFIMTGERTLQAHLHDADSPLFNFFGMNVRLSFLDRTAAGKLVTEPLHDMQVELSNQPVLVNKILDATSGHPYLVQRLCQELVLVISRQDVRIIRLKQIELILNDSAYQDDYFETVWGQAPILARIITMLVGPEGATMREIQQRLKQYDLTPPLREISTALDVLDLYSVLVRKSGRYHFLATAFPEMLQRAYGDDIETNIELLCGEYR